MLNIQAMKVKNQKKLSIDDFKDIDLKKLVEGAKVLFSPPSGDSTAKRGPHARGRTAQSDSGSSRR
jgi:hypothetical protein